jgi:hypothetical protein
MVRNSREIEQRARIVAQAFREYGKAKREFLAIAEFCSVKGWPDRKAIVQNAFKLQILLNQREEMRLEYLLSLQAPEIAAYKSISETSDRLVENWSEGDEGAIARTDSIYRGIVHEIEAHQAKLDSDALTGPFQAAQRDPEYLRARQDLQDKLQSLDHQLSC